MTGVTVDGSVDADRRAALRTLSRGVGAGALGLLAGGCLGGVLAGLPLAAAAGTDAALDIQMLQTASSLETLMVDLYGSALGTGPLGMSSPAAKAIAAMTDPLAREALVKILTETQAQHREHRLAFQGLTTAMGGREQNEPNPKYASGVAAADLSSALRMVDYAVVLEKILTDTYVLDLTLVDSVKAKEALGSVMAVEAQHLALFRAVGALLRDDTPQLVRIPIGNDLVNLPATLAAAAFPDAMDDVASSSVAEPESGAVAAEEVTSSSTPSTPSSSVVGASPSSTSTSTSISTSSSSVTRP
jgi:hypothetical protein